MKTVKKKNPTIQFEVTSELEVEGFLASCEDDKFAPGFDEAENLIVKIGEDRVGMVSLVTRQGEVLITQLYVRPEFRGFGIGTQILECLSQFSGINYLRVLATPSTVAYYEKRGFEPDAGQIILTKVLE